LSGLAAHDRHGGFVAGGFDREDDGHGVSVMPLGPEIK
jgi:hypothetical protein